MRCLLFDILWLQSLQVVRQFLLGLGRCGDSGTFDFSPLVRYFGCLQTNNIIRIYLEQLYSYITLYVLSHILDDGFLRAVRLKQTPRVSNHSCHVTGAKRTPSTQKHVNCGLPRQLNPVFCRRFVFALQNFFRRRRFILYHL